MLFRQVFAALLYGVSSLAIMFVNKIVLTEYGFPSFNAMAFFQTLTSLLMLTSARALGFISYAPIVTFFLPFPPFLCPFFFNSLLIPFPRTFPSGLRLSDSRSFPPFSFRVMREVFPLPLIFMLNVVRPLFFSASPFNDPLTCACHLFHGD